MSVSLSWAWFLGVYAWRSVRLGKLSSSTLSPKFVLPFHGPLPVLIRTRPPPGSTTTPPRDRMAESLARQLLGANSPPRFEQSVLYTVRNLPLVLSISATCPW